MYVTETERELCRAAMVANPAPAADALLDEIARLRGLLAVETSREKELDTCLREYHAQCRNIQDVAFMARVERVLG